MFKTKAGILKIENGYIFVRNTEFISHYVEFFTTKEEAVEKFKEHVNNEIESEFYPQLKSERQQKALDNFFSEKIKSSI